MEIKEIIRSNRKTIAIQILPSGEVVIKAPLRLPDEKIYKFIEEKRSWIVSHQQKVQNSLDKYEDVVKYNKLMVFGKICTVYKSKKVRKTTLNLDENKIIVPESLSTEKLYKKFISFYKTLANDYIIDRVQYISSIVGLNPAEITTTGSRGRWGACTNKGKISLSWRAIMVRPDLIDYIIVHELMHLVELNHSPRFWNGVEKMYPKYKAAKIELKKLGFVLKLF